MNQILTKTNNLTNMKNEKNYKPVSCDFYDQLEAAATTGAECTIVLKSQGDQQRELKGTIKNLETRDHIEYAQMEDGTEFRLDEIKSFDRI